MHILSWSPWARARRFGAGHLMVGFLATVQVAHTPELGAQISDTVRVKTAAPASWHLQVNGSYSSADNGFGVWTGEDARLLYSGTRFSPFVSIGRQQRPAGSQTVYAAGTYINITSWLFSIVGVGIAPDHGTVLFPRVRTDVSAFAAVPGVKGLLMSAGLTDLRFTDPRSGGRILSLGPTLYLGNGIYSGALRLNTDRASGARSSSWQLGAQWGAQGKSYYGLNFGAGNEAYQVLATNPFDARFRSVYGGVFYSKWITTNSGVSLRLDYEHKLDVYHRGAIGLSYFVDF